MAAKHFCIQCGQELDPGVRFCPKCGAPVIPPEQMPPAQPEPIPEPPQDAFVPGPAEIHEPAPETPPQKPQKPEKPPKSGGRTALIIVLVIALIAVLGVAGFIAYNTFVTGEETSSSSVREIEVEEPASTAEQPVSEPEPEAASEPAVSSISTPERTEEPAPDIAPANRQKVVVEASGSSATLTLYTYLDGSWQQQMQASAAIGSNGITSSKAEGDHQTPAGTFPILFAFSDTAQTTKLPFKTIGADSVWVCDPSSAYYNTLQSSSSTAKDWADGSGAEKMSVKFSRQSSTACICFGFNGDGQSRGSAKSGGGSALFLDGVGASGNMNSGYGDIKISGADMTQLLSLLDPGLNPVIVVRSTMAADTGSLSGSYSYMNNGLPCNLTVNFSAASSGAAGKLTLTSSSGTECTDCALYEESEGVYQAQTAEGTVYTLYVSRISGSEAVFSIYKDGSYLGTTR